MVKTPTDGFGTWAGIGGWLGERVAGACVGGSAGPGDCVPVLRQGFFCRVRIPMGSTCAHRR